MSKLTTAGFISNIWKLNCIVFLRSFLLFSAVLVPFFTDWGGISFFQIMIIQSFFMISIMLLEVPTGAIADKYGRKISLVLAALFSIAFPIIYVSKPSFWIFLLAEFIGAVGYALKSGAAEAMLYDSLVESGLESKSKSYLARLNSWNLSGILFGALAGGFVASYIGLKETMLFSSIPFILSFFITILLKEPNYHKEKISYFQQIKQGWNYFASHKALINIAIDYVVLATISYFIIWLYQPLLLNLNISLVYFGLVHALLVIVQIIFMNNYGFLENLFQSKRNLIVGSFVILSLSWFVLGISNIFSLTILGILFVGAFGLGMKPLFSNYLNKQIESKNRATTLSIISMFATLVISVSNLLIGYFVDISLSYTIIILGIICLAYAFYVKSEENILFD